MVGLDVTHKAMFAGTDWAPTAPSTSPRRVPPETLRVRFRCAAFSRPSWHRRRVAQTDLARRRREATSIPMLVAAAFSLLLVASCARVSLTPASSSAATAAPSSSRSSTTSSTPSQSPSSSSSPSPTAATRAATGASTTLAKVTVTVVNYGFSSDGVYASGLVTGVTEDTGTCTLTATSGSSIASGTIEAAPSASAMNCGRISVAVPAGDWTLSLSYSSATSQGTSQTVTVHRP